ncbi:hypothetical protein DYB25_010844 [Aphanomyces astaci]|uniref:NAD(P)-binding domain-containing protein n=1 Tax=Aphanomyces astaci TaxID=112090 RepID=A0A397A868_APHAT|nr:hypothetical protein DYB25_010844 [Aphanomyces astaci]
MLQRYPSYKVVVYDKLTYAGNLGNLHDICDDPRLMFVQGDICDATCVDAAILDHGVDTIVNFAAETHVDRSILNPDAFIHTNVLGTATLLDSARRHAIRRFHQISTDEVYGQVQAERSSVETDRLDPRSPYAASKASADLLVVSYFVTFGLPTTITRASNNVGPYQYPEKVVPLFTTNAMDDLSLPVYGDGLQQREYQYVADHSEAVDVVLHHEHMCCDGHESRGCDWPVAKTGQLRPEALKQQPGCDNRSTNPALLRLVLPLMKASFVAVVVAAYAHAAWAHPWKGNKSFKINDTNVTLLNTFWATSPGLNKKAPVNVTTYSTDCKDVEFQADRRWDNCTEERITCIWFPNGTVGRGSNCRKVTRYGSADYGQVNAFRGGSGSVDRKFDNVTGTNVSTTLFPSHITVEHIEGFPTYVETMYVPHFDWMTHKRNAFRVIDEVGVRSFNRDMSRTYQTKLPITARFL